MSENIPDVTDLDFDDVIGSETPVLIDFWADWCGPCKEIAPMLEEIAVEHKDKMTIAKLDVDAFPAVPRRYSIHGIPTLILFKEGKPLARIIGSQPKEKLLEALLPVL